ncbi:MAG: hypothetical protein ACOYA9_01720 [Bilifractor sp.]|jgi:hypothetical protein
MKKTGAESTGEEVTGHPAQHTVRIVIRETPQITFSKNTYAHLQHHIPETYHRNSMLL